MSNFTPAELLDMSLMSEHFDELGYKLSRRANADGTSTWSVSGGSPVDEIGFESRPQLWLSWLEYAAFRISEDAKFEAFRRAYELATNEERAVLCKELDYYIDNGRSPYFDEMFASIPGQSTDELPKDWIRKMREILSAADDRSFIDRVVELIPD